MSDTPQDDEFLKLRRTISEHAAFARQLVRDIAELNQRLRERVESHLAASARDVQTIQQKSVEIDALKSQLWRICKEGFGNDDTIGLEPADDYVLRKVAELRQALSGRTVSCSNCNALAAENAAMREAIKEAHDLVRWLVPNSDGLHHRTAYAALSKLKPYLK